MQAEHAAPRAHVLVGDGESPHLLKWARALAASPAFAPAAAGGAPARALWVLSSRGFAPGFEALDATLPAARRLALGTRPDAGGGNVGLLFELPRAAAWMQRVQASGGPPPAWHAHYLTSHGSLVWLARALAGLRGAIVASAWGSDVLVAPDRSAALKAATRRVLAAATLCTSDSQTMAARMHALGAREVMVFPFGLEAMPAWPVAKEPALFFANRGLEPIYAPGRVIEVFARVAAGWPEARLVVANDGSLRAGLEAGVAARGLASRVTFTGRLDAPAQARWYARARWWLSLPQSDSVAVSLLEAMAHGAIPIVSDLPANREVVTDGVNGLVLGEHEAPGHDLHAALGAPDGDLLASLHALAARAEAVAAANRAWVEANGLFAPAVARFLARLAEVEAASPGDAA
jgi:glycosyltransferase involved in cell wall biosynthesis